MTQSAFLMTVVAMTGSSLSGFHHGLCAPTVKLWRHLLHEQSEAGRCCFVRQRAEAETRDNAANTQCRDFRDRLGDPWMKPCSTLPRAEGRSAAGTSIRRAVSR